MSIGLRIKALRARAGLTQDRLGELCDATKGAISQWENNDTIPKTPNLIMLRDALLEKKQLRVSIDWILFGDAPYSLASAENSAHLVANPIAHYHPRPGVQRACDLIERLNDDGLNQAISYLEFLVGKQPDIKAKLA